LAPCQFCLDETDFGPIVTRIYVREVETNKTVSRQLLAISSCKWNSCYGILILDPPCELNPRRAHRPYTVHQKVAHVYAITMSSENER
jgi:hypothetical protein